MASAGVPVTAKPDELPKAAENKLPLSLVAPPPIAQDELRKEWEKAGSKLRPEMVRDNKLALIKYGLEHGAIIKFCEEKESKVPQQKSLLFVACELGQFDIAKFALQCKSELIDFPDCTGMTPVMVAAKNHHVEIVELLATAEANFDRIDQLHRNVFHWAVADKSSALPVQTKTIAVVTHLLNAKQAYKCTAEWDLPDMNWETPWHVAKRCKVQEAVLQLMRDAGCKTDSEPKLEYFVKLYKDRDKHKDFLEWIQKMPKAEEAASLRNLLQKAKQKTNGHSTSEFNASVFALKFS